MTAPRDKSYSESLTAALTDPEEAAAYLDAVIDMEDPTALVAALRQVAAAHGMAEVARRTSLGDKTLFRSLGDNGNPTLATLQKVLHSMGLRLSVQPAETPAA
jgi:probable addiction module antidote protein